MHRIPGGCAVTPVPNLWPCGYRGPKLPMLLSRALQSRHIGGHGCEFIYYCLIVHGLDLHKDVWMHVASKDGPGIWTRTISVIFLVS
jgi:hypothetical protein